MKLECLPRVSFADDRIRSVAGDARTWRVVTTAPGGRLRPLWEVFIVHPGSLDELELPRDVGDQGDEV